MGSDLRKSVYLVYLFIAIALGMLGIALYYTIESVIALQRGSNQGAMTQLMTGLFGILVSIYLFTQFRKRFTLINPPVPPKIFSVVECNQCGFKSLRTFAKKDFVFKTVGTCEKCMKPMLITGIYAETEKKK